MALISWTDSLSVKVAVLDLQHQRLISVINELHDAMRQGKGKDVLEKTLSALSSYTVIHFKTEERYFDQFGYPDAAGHKRIHDLFVQKISDFKEAFEKGRLGVSIEVMNFLRDWLKNHIMETDKRYSAFFNERGLK
ncbi:MAG: hemerythrin family protein [Kiritimatiellaeota bacterium]|nr:hemerythrin family protein [Kiritimatiellota bacterium]